MAPKRRRTDLSLKDKTDIIKEVENGAKYMNVANKYGIGKSTVGDIVWKKQAIIDAFTGLSANRKRITSSNFPQVEECMNTWIASAEDLETLSDRHLLGQAQLFATGLGIDQNRIKEGWISRWKARIDLKSKILHRTSNGANSTVINDSNWTNSRNLHDILKIYQQNDIYITVKTGLLWKLLASDTTSITKEQFKGTKAAEDYITIQITGNLAGDKEPLLIIGKSRNPCCFGRSVPPLQYETNIKPWMTEALFSDFLQKFDQKMAEQNRHVALIMDNSQAHVRINNLTNVEQVFLPPNTNTSTNTQLQLETGIIERFKTNYRRRLAIRQLISFNERITFKFNLLDALHLSRAAWSDVTSIDVQNCFRHFVILSAEIDEKLQFATAAPPPYDTTWDQLRATGLLANHFDLQSYIHFDNDLRITGLSDEIAIKEEEDYGDHRSEEDETAHFLRPFEAIRCIDQLQNCLTSLPLDETIKESTQQTLTFLQDAFTYQIIHKFD